MDLKQEIYILYWCYGEYEDARQIALASSSTPGNLVPIEEQHHAHLEQRKKWFVEIEAWEEEYRKNNSTPSLPQQEKVPKWKEGLRMDEITPEMRASRDAIKQRNEKAMQEYGDLMDVWTDKFNEEREKHLRAMGVPEDEEELDIWSDYQYSESSYVIKTVRWVG